MNLSSSLGKNDFGLPTQAACLFLETHERCVYACILTNQIVVFFIKTKQQIYSQSGQQLAKRVDEWVKKNVKNPEKSNQISFLYLT